MTLIKSISGIRGTIGGGAGVGLNPLDIVKFTSAYATLIRKTCTVKNNNCISPNCRHFPCRWIISRPHTPMVACMSPGVRASRKRSQ